MSCSAISLSASSGNARMSPSRLRVNSTLPAPTNAILGIRFLAVDGRRWARCRVADSSARDPEPEERTVKKIPLVVAAIAAAALVTASSAGARPAARQAGRDHDLARADRRGAEGDPQARRAVQQVAPGHRRARPAGLQRRRDGAEAAGRDRLGQLPRHRVRLRLGRAERVAVEQGRRHLEGHQGGRASPGTASTRRAARPPPSAKIVGFPAVIDNLAVVYNTKILKAAGVAPPKRTGRGPTTARWPRSSRTRARTSSAPAIPISGSEDTVWRLWPMIWQQGGDVLDKAQQEGALRRARRASRRCSC